MDALSLCLTTREMTYSAHALGRRRKTVLGEVKDLHWPPQPHIPLTNVKTKMTREELILKGRLEPPRLMMHSRKLLSRYSTKEPPSLLTHW